MYYLFTRWGRVGMAGQNNCSEAISRSEVKQKYLAKARGKMKNGYKVIEVNYKQDEEVDSDNENIYEYFRESQLPWDVQELIKLIFDRKMMHFHMK